MDSLMYNIFLFCLVVLLFKNNKIIKYKSILLITIGFVLPTYISALIVLYGIYKQIVLLNKGINKRIIMYVYLIISYVCITQLILNKQVNNFGVIEVVICMLFYVLVVLELDTEKNIMYAIECFYKFSFFYTLYGLVEWIIYFLTNRTIMRMDSIFTNAVTFSVYTGISLIIGICLYKNKEVQLTSRFVYSNIMLQILGVFLAMSRSTWIGVILVIIVIFFKENLMNKLKYIMYYTPIVVITMFLIPPKIYELALNRLVTAFDITDASTSYRLSLFEATFEMIKDNFILGSGFGNFLDMVGVYNPSLYSNKITHPHNTYLELLHTSGIIGFLLIIIFLVYIIYKGAHASKTNFSKQLYNNLLLVMMFFAVFGMFDRILTSFNTAIIFWFALGLITFNLKSENDDFKKT